MANVGDRVTENTFLRALATAVFKDSIDKKAKLNPDRLTSHTALLQKYIDNETNRETQCLYALQALIQEMEHPQGIIFC
ncbi:Eukaryotic translation initiation factor 4 gamma 3 [Gonioctena quinquepunctata]|nr:Eukaryotic translation initiation factor 4 gamma 3 [Gonioctena quinquepunctata]